MRNLVLFPDNNDEYSMTIMMINRHDMSVIIMFFSPGNMGRAALIIGGVLNSVLDPTKHTDSKSLEVKFTHKFASPS